MIENKELSLLEYIITKIVDYPEEVYIDRVIEDDIVVLNVRVKSEDMGKLIGKSGQTARAIRTLLRILGAKLHIGITMKILEPTVS